jgi:hypothetical protein
MTQIINGLKYPSVGGFAMTYNGLIQDVITYMERDDDAFVDKIPTFIGLAEFAIATEVKTLEQLVVVSTTLTTNQDVLNKPALWRKTVSMKVDGQPLLLRSQDYVAQYQSESTSARPKYYADYDYSNWAFAPLPDQPYTVEIIYYSRVQPLSYQNQQNLLTEICPQALLFGTLLQAQGYLKALDKLPIWKGYYDNAIAALKKEDNVRRVDRNVSVQEP